MDGFDKFSRNARYYGILRDILRYNRSCRNDRMIADRDAGQKGGV